MIFSNADVSGQIVWCCMSGQNFGCLQEWKGSLVFTGVGRLVFTGMETVYGGYRNGNDV